MKTTFWSTLAASLILADLTPRTLRAADKNDSRGEAKELINKARDLKAERQYEESEKLAREARQLEANAREPSENERGRRSEIGAPEKEMDQLRARLKELDASDRADEAAQVKRQIQKIEKVIADAARRDASRVRENDRQLPRRLREEPSRADRFEAPGQPDRPPSEFGDRRQPLPPRGPMPPAMEDAPRRLRHLQQAIEHLHAAGMHEPAENLEREGDRLRGEWEGRRDFRPVPPGNVQEPRAVMAELESNLAELQRQMNAMRRALQDMREMLNRRDAEER